MPHVFHQVSLLRRLSLLGRKRRSRQECQRILRDFADWREAQRVLPPPSPTPKRLLIIRLDDIGDYLLFRNQLAMYKKSARWQDHRITLLGNASWQELFTLLDAASVDDTVWVNKNQYLVDAAYRLALWERLRAGGFDTVIAASRTRPLQLDDLCMLAAAPSQRFGSVNTYIHPEWNRVSDALYDRLFQAIETQSHEFEFNGQLTSWLCGIRYPGSRPSIELQRCSPKAGDYILCFVGANTRSKRWPARRWIEFIALHGLESRSRVILAGAGKAETDAATRIAESTNAQSIAGQVSLVDMLDWVAGAKAVITNDTMAAHMSASCNRPTVIIANGVNYARFTDYQPAGIDRVVTVYPDVFLRQRRRGGKNFAYHYPDAVSQDIASITAREVLDKLTAVLGQRGSDAHASVP
jgi:ADP-heptose:LPS heptosyltransferase